MKRLVVMLGVAMFAMLHVRGRTVYEEYCMCWGSEWYDYFRYGDHRPYQDAKPGVGYDDVPGCKMLFTDLLILEDDVGGVGMGPTVDTTCTVYRDGVAIATIGTVGGYNWFTDCDVVLGRTYRYEIRAEGYGKSTGPTNVTCHAIYRADIATNEVTFSADGGSRKVSIAIYKDTENDSFYDPYALFMISADDDWLVGDRKENSQWQYTAFVIYVDENTNDVPRESMVTIEHEGFKWPVKVRQDAKGLAEGEIKVAFDGNGGEPSVSSAVFEVGRQYESLPTATLDGYRFVGWSTLADGGLLIGEDSIVSEETSTLYAVWKSEAEPIWTIEDGVLTAVDLNGATDIEIPAVVTAIGTNVFEECTGLKSVVIPGNVASIGGHAFYSCYLEKIVFANGLVDIGEFAFWSCDRLHDVTFPNTLKTIGTQTFYNSNGLKGIYIPASLDSIGQEAFCQCPNLAAFSVAPDNTAFSAVGGILYDKLGTTVVYVPNALTSVEVPEGVGRIAKRAFSGCMKLDSITLPSTLTNIESYAFTQCRRLSAVTIPANVSRIGKMAFWLCVNLVSIDVASGNAVFSSYDGCLYENGGKNLHSVPNGKREVELLPDIVAINDCAFYSCGKLVAVMLPDGLTSIGASAFRYCSLLSSIAIPASVTSIGPGAFSDCSGLTSVTIPDGVTSIGPGAFNYCSNLKTVSLPKSFYGKLDSSVFGGCSADIVISYRDDPAVTFDANGGKFSDGKTMRYVQATPGNLWGKMPMPALSGQVFDGYYTAKEGGDLVTASSEVPNGSATYYAHWTPRLGLAAASEWSGEFTTDSWCGQGTVSHDGRDALRSGIIYDGQSSYLMTRVKGTGMSGDGKLTFWWSVSCEAGGKDALRLLVDGTQVKMISGDVGWTKVEVPIWVPETGTRVIKWNYTKNGSVTKGEDFGWVDQISWEPPMSMSGIWVFDANGGKFSDGKPRKYVDAKPGNLWGKMPMPAMDGYVFAGWYTALYGGELLTSSSKVPNYYANYYAHWTPRLGLAAASEWAGAFETDSWCGQGAVTHDGKDALRSGIIYDKQNSYLLTRVPGPGTLTFWWKVSCEAGGNDALRLLVDGVQVQMISGDIDWTKVTVPINGSGTHVIKWNYTKNGAVTKGQDFGWLDQISWQAQ